MVTVHAETPPEQLKELLAEVELERGKMDDYYQRVMPQVGELQPALTNFEWAAIKTYLVAKITGQI